jgi:hypothetical protein
VEPPIHSQPSLPAPVPSASADRHPSRDKPAMLSSPRPRSAFQVASPGPQRAGHARSGLTPSTFVLITRISSPNPAGAATACTLNSAVCASAFRPRASTTLPRMSSPYRRTQCGDSGDPPLDLFGDDPVARQHQAIVSGASALGRLERGSPPRATSAWNSLLDSTDLRTGEPAPSPRAGMLAVSPCVWRIPRRDGTAAALTVLIHRDSCSESSSRAGPIRRAGR